MTSIWQTLGISAGSDERAVRQAYAAKLKLTNPEDDADGFMRLREAYEVALRQSRLSSQPTLATPHETSDPVPLSSLTPVEATEGPTENEASFAADRSALEAALQMEPRPTAEQLTTTLARLLASPLMDQLAFRAGCEQWLAQLIAGHLPAADPLVEPAIAAFGWHSDRRGYAPSRAAAQVLQRARERAFVATIQSPEAPLHRGWQALSRRPGHDWLMRARALEPGLPKKVGALLAVAAGQLPGILGELDPKAVAWWRGRLARRRMVLDDFLSSWVIIGFAALIAEHLTDGATTSAGPLILIGVPLVIGLPVAMAALRQSARWRTARLAIVTSPWGSNGWILGGIAITVLSVVLPAKGWTTLLIPLACLMVWSWCRLAVTRRPDDEQLFWQRFRLWILAVPAATVFLPGLLDPSDNRALPALAVTLMLLEAWQRGGAAIVRAAVRFLPQRRDIMLSAGAVALLLVALLMPAAWPSAQPPYRVSILALLGMLSVSTAAGLAARPRWHRVALVVLFLASFGSAMDRSMPPLIATDDGQSPPLVGPDDVGPAVRNASLHAPADSGAAAASAWQAPSGAQGGTVVKTPSPGPANDPAATLGGADRIISQAGSGGGPDAESVVAAYLTKAAALAALKRHAERLPLYDEAERRNGSPSTSKQMMFAALTELGRADALFALGRFQEAIAVCDRTASLYRGNSSISIAGVISAVQLLKGAALAQLGRSAEAIAIFDGIIADDGGHEDPTTSAMVARALLNRAAAHRALGELAAMHIDYSTLATSFSATSLPELQLIVATGMLLDASMYDAAGRVAEAVTGYHSVVDRFHADPEPAMRRLVVQALLDIGNLQAKTYDWPASVATNRALLGEYGASDDAETKRYVTMARYNFARALAMQGDVAGSVASLRAMIRDGRPIDCGHIAGDHAFDKVRGDTRFKHLTSICP